ncbi:MAG: UvrD-helicase domain-containing protein [Phycisphaerales bacterium]|nr:UvrD-helicase domain-containing protein [Phycisphaerales bacterium]
MTPHPRELATANAGCGKTFTLANRVIGWMIERWRATGEIGVEGILAATFTRKAAGEILDRILKHLAQGATSKVFREAFKGTVGLNPEPTQEQYASVLEALVGSMDAAQIGTLDSVFHRIAAACAGELGLPAGWTMTSESGMRQLRLQAIDELLQASTQATIDAIVIAAEEELLKGRGPEAIHDALWDSGVMYAWQSREDGDAGAWRWLLDIEDSLIAPGARRLTVSEIERACEELECAPVALTKAGEPSKPWLTARANIVSAARSGTWPPLLGQTLVQAASTGSKYRGAMAPDAFVDALHPLAGHAKAVLVSSLKTRMQSWLLLLGGVDEHLSSLQHETGLYDFADIARTLARGDVFQKVGADWIEYRLDMAMRDIALDEFQDTSVEQFKVLQPVLQELFAGDGSHETPRHLLVVADEKQSIYGWRGGTPQLLGELESLGGSELHRMSLAKSWRSAPRVLEFVDSVFAGMKANGALLAAEQAPVSAQELEAVGLGALGSESGPIASALDAWPWTPHEAQHKDMTGGVVAWQAPWAGKDKTPPLDLAVEIAQSRMPHARSIGILVSTNKQAAAIASRLRARGIEASEEGAAKPKDLHAFDAVAALLHLAEHPGDRVAAFTVSHSPLGPIVGLTPLETIAQEEQDSAIEQCASRMRLAVLQDGLEAFLAELVEEVRDSCDGRNARALDQLVHLARRWSSVDASASSTLAMFLDHARRSGLGSDSDGQVRVMTVHKAKGLEFDEVILPTLHDALVKEQAGCRIARLGPLDPVAAVAPSTGLKVRWAAPVLDVFRNQMLKGQYQDRLSGLYVALTRARRGLHLVFQYNAKKPRPEETCSGQNIIRAAVGDLDNALLSRGDTEQGPFWWGLGDDKAWLDETIDPLPEPPKPSPVGLNKIEAPEQPPVEAVELQVTSGRPRREGIVLHECFAQIEWLEDGEPGPDQLEEAFKRAAIQLGRPVGKRQREQLTARFLQAMRGDKAKALSRNAHDAWNVDELEVLREVPLIHGSSVQRIDRLVLGRRGGEVVRAAVLDFKSGVTDLEQAMDRYRPQLDAYVQRVSEVWRLDVQNIEASLLLIDA